MKNIVCALLVMISSTIFSQEIDCKHLEYGAQRTGKRTDEAMQKWRSNRFGQFVTFGLFSVPGGHWKGKYYPYAAEWIKSSANISNEDYDAIRANFNPTKFDARAMAKMAKEMGAKSALITTKFHDGFCLWPSKYTDFDIENTPYKKDLLKEFVDAYNNEGIDVVFYYSVMDWHHPDWRYDIKNEQDSVAFKRYWDWMTNQIVELMTNYPTVKGFWYDGTWDKSIKKNGKYTWELQKKMKEINPGIVSGSRLRADDFGARHFDSNGQMMGDYEQGWERRLPYKKMDNDWECVMTVPENQWGYHSDWQGHVKTPTEVIEMIVGSAAYGGNFMLNFGPKGDGSIRNEERMLAKTIGNWMAKNGEMIYDCEYAGLKMQNWGYYTKKRNTNTIYMGIFNVPVDYTLKVQLPKGTKIDKAVFLSIKGDVKIEEAAKNEYYLHIPKRKYKETFAIKLELCSENKKSMFYVAPKI